MPSSTDPQELKVLPSTPVPAGYRFVPKGNIYITKNCRSRTHAADQPLYVVADKRNRTLGLRCPEQIYRQVLASHDETAPKRAQAVQKRDAQIEDNFEAVVLRLFPQAPKDSIPVIVKHAVEKRSGRVGRSTKIGEMEDKVMLAVRAHIRHVHTDYERLLREGVSRGEARQKVWERINEIAKEWGATTGNLFRKRKDGGKGKRARRRAMGTASAAKKRKRPDPVMTKKAQLIIPTAASAGAPSATEQPENKKIRWPKQKGRYARLLAKKARGEVVMVSPDRVRVTRRMARESVGPPAPQESQAVEIIEISSDDNSDDDGGNRRQDLEDDAMDGFIVDNDDKEALAVFSLDEDTSDYSYESDRSSWSD
ncbi:hypothetical protein QBC40DRAFT_69615 [Triangularia verruculosa]|uniref:DUF2293 domain-containing protein n=1 Tax=Triangularia verruculosa TaxID=2587418 RepID=A0AAN6XJM0_9PEZI|nr:hypothetical protein QBC40DRAFT_69615 [Triangularia verruculosa]